MVLNIEKVAEVVLKVNRNTKRDKQNILCLMSAFCYTVAGNPQFPNNRPSLVFYP